MIVYSHSKSTTCRAAFPERVPAPAADAAFAPRAHCRPEVPLCSQAHGGRSSARLPEQRAGRALDLGPGAGTLRLQARHAERLAELLARRRALPQRVQRPGEVRAVDRNAV